MLNSNLGDTPSNFGARNPAKRTYGGKVDQKSKLCSQVVHDSKGESEGMVKHRAFCNWCECRENGTHFRMLTDFIAVLRIPVMATIGSIATVGCIATVALL